MASEWTEERALPDLEKLLAPISGQRPAGENLRYDPLYDEVREARREEDPALPQGVWKVDPKKADWKAVESLAQGALESKSKDLQLAGWLTEAWVHRCGFEGAEHGTRLVIGLCESFWDCLFPELGEDGDLDLRLGPLEWMDQRLSQALKTVPVTGPETEEESIFRWTDWESALYRANLERAGAGAELEGQADSSKFLVSVSLTPTSLYRDLDSSLARCREAITGLANLLEERCGAPAPRFRQVREVLDAIHRFVRGVLRQRGDEEAPQEALPPPVSEVQTMDSPKDDENPLASGGPIRSRAEAYRRLSETAEYLARTEPHSPTPFLVRRAVSWGSMTVEELLRELLADKADLPTVFKLLGIASGKDSR